MSTKYTREMLNKLEAEEVYSLLLNQEIKCFPFKFFCGEDGQANGGRCLKYLLEKHLNITSEDIPQAVNTKFFHRYKLGGMIGRCFNDSPYQAINHIYPNVYKEWQLGNVPRNFWSDENIKDALLWLIITKRKKYNAVHIEVDKSDLINNGLKSLFTYKFNNNITKVNEHIHTLINSEINEQLIA